MKLKQYLGLTLVALGLTVTASAAGGQWLHVRVQESQTEKINLNIPVALISSVLPVIEKQHWSHGMGSGIRWDDKEFSLQDLREIWAAVKSNGSYELAKIETKDARVNVFLDGQYLMVKSLQGSDDQVDVKVPVSVIDALLSGTGNELNLSAGIQALQNLGTEEVVSLRARDKTVRVWIDKAGSN